jgi:hypothetical protein
MAREPGLSARAQRFLRRDAHTRRTPATPDAMRSLLAAQGLQANLPLLAFEARFGGRTLAWASNEVVLGVGRMAQEVGDLHAGPDDSRVLVGQQDPWTAISMSPDGRLWSHGPDDAPWELAVSAAAYVEQLARRATIAGWCADPFRVLLEPDGAAIAAALALHADGPASDEVEAAWAGDACWLIQRRRGDPYATGFADLLCRDLEAAAGTLLALRRVRPGIRVRVIGTTATTEAFARGGYASPGEVPDAAGWRGEQWACSFAYLGSCLAYLGVPDDEGVVWLLGGQGSRRVEQLVRPGADPTAGFVEWSSFATEQAVRRLYLPVEGSA